MKKFYLVVMIGLFVGGLNSDALALLNLEGDKVVVTASRIEQEGSRVAANVTTITNEQIEASNAQSVPELLQEIEGVFVYDFSTTKTSTLDIRGFGDTSSRNVLVLVNDRRLNAIDSGAADLVQIPINAVERIEIIRGASSVLYGDNAVGGVVNIITKKGAEGFNGSFTATYDSYDSRGQALELNGQADKLSYYVSGKYLDKRGYRDNSDELYKDVNTRLDYDFTERTSLSVQYGYHEDQYELPGGLNATELATLGRRGSADDGDVAQTDDQFVQLSLSIAPLEDSYIGHFVIDGTYRDRKLYDEINAFGFITNRDVETWGISAKYIYDQEILGRKVDFVTGIDYYTSDNDILGSGSNSDDLTISRDDIGVFTNLQFETLDDLFVIGGVRYYTADYTFDQRSGTPSLTTRNPDEIVSSGGLKYEYAKGSNIYANYQQTFRFLTTNEWYSSFSGLNTNLDQQTGEQIEIGVKHNFNDKAVVAVTPYWIKTENEIFFDPTNGFFGSNSNYDEIRRLGVEVSTRLDIKEFIQEQLEDFQKFEFFANYTYQNPEFQEGTNNGKDVPFVPRHQSSYGLITKFWDHYNITFLGRYIGSRFAINDTGNALPKAKPYLVHDLKLSFTKDFYEFFVLINNLFDREYETYHAASTDLSRRDVFPADERNFLFGAKLKF